jgi:hypothetical protein
MTEFFKLVNLKLETEWLNFLATHGIQQSYICFYPDVVGDHTCFYHQDEFETGGPNRHSCIYIWTRHQRRITVAFEDGVLHHILSPTNSMVRV